MDERSHGGRCDDARPASDVDAEHPWCSLGRAVAAAPAGATVLVRDGTYDALAVRGRMDRPLTVRAAPGDRPEIRGIAISGSRDVRVEGLRITDIAQIDDSFEVTLMRNDASPHGIVARGGADLRFERNHVHDLTIDLPARPGEPGPRCNSFSEEAGMAPRCGHAFRINGNSRVEVVGNRIEGIPADGIQMAGTADVRIAGNRFERIAPSVDPAEHSDAIQVVGGNAGTRIVGNVFVDSARGMIVHPLGGEAPEWPGAASDMVIADNLFVQMRDWAARLYDVDGLRFEHNTAWDAGTGVELRDDPAHPGAMSGVRFFDNVVGVLSADEAMFAKSDRNLIGRGPRLGPRDAGGEPAFRNPSALDYRLPPGSPFAGRGAVSTATGAVPAA